MSIQGIRGGSPSALPALKLALRLAQPGGGESGPIPGAPSVLAPDAVLRDVVARAQFMASLRAASAAVEQVGTVLEMYGPTPDVQG